MNYGLIPWRNPLFWRLVAAFAAISMFAIVLVARAKYPEASVPAKPVPSPSLLPPLLDKPMVESDYVGNGESDYSMGKGEIKELLEEERAGRDKSNLDFLDKLPVVFQASVVCFDLLRDIDTYESVACSCDASQVPPTLHRKIAVQTKALNSWVKESTVWKGKNHWVKERR
jgi:hypothetical protein